MAETTLVDHTERTPVLDRTVNLAAVSWSTIAWAAILFAALLLRLPQLGLRPLSANEAHLAHDGYRLFRGATTGPGNEISSVGPVPALLEGLGMFLFGASDATARIMPALLGLGMVAAILGLRPVIGSARALGAGALLALSPTAVYLSRTVSRESFVAAFALFAVTAFVRLGLTDGGTAARRRWAVLFGVALALTFGSGPSALSVLLALGLGTVAGTLIDTRPENALRRSLAALSGSRDASLFALVGFVATLVAVFSRLFTDFAALGGIGRTFVDWGRLLSTASSATPTQFFLLAILLYEILALVLAITTSLRASALEAARLPWSFVAVWFAAALLIFSFSSGSAPEHAIHVVLPLLILGGFGLGELVSELDPRALVTQRIGLFVLLTIGFLIALFAELVLLGRIDNALDQGDAIVEAIATFVLAVLPLGVGAVMAAPAGGRRGWSRQAGPAIVLAVSVLLALFTLRSAVELGFFNADESTELLAQQTATPAVKQIVARVNNLSRDYSLTVSSAANRNAGSARDPAGSNRLSIAIDRRVQWPFRWYFRDYPDATVVADGQAPTSGAQIAIAPDEEGMAENGYAPRDFPVENRVPGSYAAPDFGEIVRNIFFPSHWEQGVKYLLFRSGVSAAEPESVTLGMVGQVANIVTPNAGPFGLFDQAGAGSGNGQFNQPRGIAVSPDGEQIYVVDMANARVEHFDATGQFIDVWGGQNGGITFGTANGGLGPTGVTVGSDGLVYVCDTWNHRIAVLDDGGRLVREFGQFGDTKDAPDATGLTGSFFGPRAIAVYEDEIYVVDTGNERVQVFGLDGTFKRAWGGNGNGPAQFIEPVGIAIDASGRVYVADSGNGRISIFTTSGAPITQWPVAAWSGNLYFEPYLAIDDTGYVYASSSASGSVEVYDPSGELLTEIRQVDDTQLDQPVGLAWSPAGDLLITDKGLNAVLRVIPPELPPIAGAGEAPAASPVAASPVASPVASPAAAANG